MHKYYYIPQLIPRAPFHPLFPCRRRQSQHTVSAPPVQLAILHPLVELDVGPSTTRLRVVPGALDVASPCVRVVREGVALVTALAFVASDEAEECILAAERGAPLDGLFGRDLERGEVESVGICDGIFTSIIQTSHESVAGNLRRWRRAGVCHSRGLGLSWQRDCGRNCHSRGLGLSWQRDCGRNCHSRGLAFSRYRQGRGCVFPRQRDRSRYRDCRGRPCFSLDDRLRLRYSRARDGINARCKSFRQCENSFSGAGFRCRSWAGLCDGEDLGLSCGAGVDLSSGRVTKATVVRI